MSEPKYTREEVQHWRDDIAHAAADMVGRAGNAEWKWLEDGIRKLAAAPVAAHAWTKVADKLPPAEEPVLLLVNGTVYEGSLEWERPSFEETFEAFQYFADKDNHCDWEWWDVTHWMPMPELPPEEEMTEAEPAQADLPEPIDWKARPETIFGN